MTIEIVTTPNQNLKETGFGSATACQNVADVLIKQGYLVAVNVCVSQENLAAIVARKPDLVIPAVKYIPGDMENDIWLTSYFENSGINYTGSTSAALRFDSDKVLAKSLLSDLGITTAKYFTAIPGKYLQEVDLPIRFPLFLKPMDAANGSGIDDSSLVFDISGFESKVRSLYNAFNVPVLVEEYLDGPEYTAAVVELSSGELLAAPIEIIPPESATGVRILGERIKRDGLDKMQSIADSKIRSRVGKLAKQVFKALGARDYGRIDFRANRNGDINFIEANLVPGMADNFSYYPEAFKISNGFTYNNVIDLITENGLKRSQK